MVFLVILVLIIIAGMGWTKYQGTKALTFTHVDVAGLSLDEIVAIGGKASGSLTGRLTGNTPTARRTGNGGAEWQAQVQGNVMEFSVQPLPGGRGYRVGGVATLMRIAQVRMGSNQGIWGLSKAISNAIYRVLGIPHNPSALVRRRNRVLRAITNGGTAIDAAAPQYPAVEEPGNASR
jgi:hypothetical protein